MMKFYRYLYYRLYSWNMKKWGEEDVPQWNALIGVSFMMFTNLTTIGIGLQFFKLTDFFLRDQIPKKELLILMVVIGAFNFSQFVVGGKYLKIAESYKDEDEKKKKRNTYLLWLYTVLSFVACYGLAFLYGKINGFF